MKKRLIVLLIKPSIKFRSISIEVRIAVELVDIIVEGNSCQCLDALKLLIRIICYRFLYRLCWCMKSAPQHTPGKLFVELNFNTNFLGMNWTLERHIIVLISLNPRSGLLHIHFAPFIIDPSQIGSGLTASSSVIAVTAGNTHTAMYPGSFKFSLESGTLGMCLAGAVGSADITKTNVGSTYMKCMDYNTGTEAFADVSDSTGGAFTQWHYFPAATDENGDACLIGNANPFCGIYIDINQAVDYTGDALTWEFCTAIAGGEGTWSTLTIIYDKTDGTSQDGKRSFGTDGYIFFEPPGATWVPIVLDTQEAYWIRARISTNGNVGNNGTINGVEHDVVTYTNAPQMQHACTIDAVRITNHNTTVHSGSSIKFYVYNQTQHTFSTELDWPVNCFAARINLGSAMTCAAGDAISLLISQEDSGNQDPTNVTVEFELTYA